MEDKWDENEEVQAISNNESKLCYGVVCCCVVVCCDMAFYAEYHYHIIMASSNYY